MHYKANIEDTPADPHDVKWRFLYYDGTGGESWMKNDFYFLNIVLIFFIGCPEE
jgi:hypothetical protein